ncbi:GNAT family N-acetyltransferase [Alteromonas genovensis]|uniref:GNAT family N-acetyltransferase n=1 Tax=Alteromonas genovensis TaxID=471225 RepID=A0A6N9THY5_9ALTE|nr:GNAT family N-acetyltransferase [Alteromonas genovensis]NDW14308.1 GNAT family N-acetyltransferase [Alteromonas genovensis]
MKDIITCNSHVKVYSTPSEEFVINMWTKVSRNLNLSSPFLTPEWVSSWYFSATKKPTFVIYFEGNEPCGVCFIGDTKRVKLGLVLKVGLLNQAGNIESDQAWIEYNDLVCADRSRNNFITCLIDYLKSEGFDLLIVSMIQHDAIRRWNQVAPNPIDEMNFKGYTSELCSGNSFFNLSYLSKNTRSQIKRSNNQLERLYGPLAVVTPKNQNESLYFLEELSKFHKKQWSSSIEGSGFNNPAFTLLQKRLIENKELAAIVGVFAGETALGFCINYLHQQKVFFYCSGINHELSTKHIKPGYSMHNSLMQYYAKLGFSHYDFLGGDARYKASFSNSEYYLSSVTIPLGSFKALLASIYAGLRNIVQH